MKEGDKVIDKKIPDLIWNVDEIGEDYFLLSTDHFTLTADIECIDDFDVVESSEN